MSEAAEDWIDGFLMVGNQPVLNLLNTRPVVAGDQREMLSDTGALVRWLESCGLVTTPMLNRRWQNWSDEAGAGTFLRELVRYREELRDVVLRIEGGRPPSRAFLDHLNKRLSAHPYRTAVASKAGGLEAFQAEGPSVADTLWAAILHATVELLIVVDPKRLRQCESCVVHFYDNSKKNARRWCSMRMCGNKIKVAAYQQRQRQAPLKQVRDST